MVGCTSRVQKKSAYRHLMQLKQCMHGWVCNCRADCAVSVDRPQGVRRRKAAETAMNARSSRSHAVFILTVARRSNEQTRFSQLFLVDLAGECACFFVLGRMLSEHRRRQREGLQNRGARTATRRGKIDKQVLVVLWQCSECLEYRAAACSLPQQQAHAAAAELYRGQQPHGNCSDRLPIELELPGAHAATPRGTD